MLSSRCLRLSAVRITRPTMCAWSGRAPQLKMLPTPIWYTKPQIVAFSKDAKPEECYSAASAEKPISLKSSTTEKISQLQSPPSFPVCPPNNTPSSTSDSKLTQEIIDKSSAGSLGKTDVKLPSREQVESFVFKSLVYLWDFTYYVIRLTQKLIETYVINNSTVQHYWKLLLKRMDEARKELKPK